MIALMFDLSLTRTAVVRDDGIEATWLTEGFIKPKDAKFPALRFNDFRLWAHRSLKLAQPQLVIYEQLGAGNNLAEAQIMLKNTLLELCALERIPTKSIHPTHLKKFITGTGKAEKSDVMAVIALRFPGYDPNDDKGGDVADALGIALWWRAGCPPSDAELERLAVKERKRIKALAPKAAKVQRANKPDRRIKPAKLPEATPCPK